LKEDAAQEEDLNKSLIEIAIDEISLNESLCSHQFSVLDEDQDAKE